MSKYAKRLQEGHGKERKPLQGQATAEQGKASDLLSFNFKQLDFEQGHNFDGWRERDLLCEMLTRMKDLSSRTINELRSTKDSAFSIYAEFPKKTAFKHPKHVPEDAVWARFHVKGEPVVAGHLVGSVFYVVFLDGEHQFYKTDKKNT
ncbi:hypothetical protein LJR290_006147 [Variovorax sp. LjRoot290]|uniref:hypothetical protein n=1 Tax=Variovorax sp. LjRoot290 TaxID=3342316 RepID=UPI003ED018BF